MSVARMHLSGKCLVNSRAHRSKYQVALPPQLMPIARTLHRTISKSELHRACLVLMSTTSVSWAVPEERFDRGLCNSTYPEHSNRPCVTLTQGSATATHSRLQCVPLQPLKICHRPPLPVSRRAISISGALTTYSNRYVRFLPLSTTIALLHIAIIRALQKLISQYQLVSSIWFVVIPDQAVCCLP